MPIVSALTHARRYVERPSTRQRLADVKTLLETIIPMQIALSLKKRLLVHGIWEVSRATGDFRGRYRSEGVIREVDVPIQRDHIYKKSILVEELLGVSPDIDRVIERARCCVVTTAEHQRLHSV